MCACIENVIGILLSQEPNKVLFILLALTFSSTWAHTISGCILSVVTHLWLSNSHTRTFSRLMRTQKATVSIAVANLWLYAYLYKKCHRNISEPGAEQSVVCFVSSYILIHLAHIILWVNSVGGHPVVAVEFNHTNIFVSCGPRWQYFLLLWQT